MRSEHQDIYIVSETGMRSLFKRLAFLQEQVGGAQPSSQREQTLVALRAEVARLEEAESLQRAADSALNSLQDKIADLKVELFHEMQPESKAHEFRNVNASIVILGALIAFCATDTSFWRVRYCRLKVILDITFFLAPNCSYYILFKAGGLYIQARVPQSCSLDYSLLQVSNESLTVMDHATHRQPNGEKQVANGCSFLVIPRLHNASFCLLSCHFQSLESEGPSKGGSNSICKECKVISMTTQGSPFTY